MHSITIGIYRYPYSLKSAVYGLEELFLMANRVCMELSVEVQFVPTIFEHFSEPQPCFKVVLLPPAINSGFYLAPDATALEGLRRQYQQGGVIASACAGAFILAASGIAGGRTLTTHWGLADSFRGRFPVQTLDTNKLLIDYGDVLSAGGMMSWLDLALELVARYTSAAVMRQLGKMLVIDTAPREQRYYQQFQPSYLHGDQGIIELQQWINQSYAQPISVTALAKRVNTTERTLQRRFIKATGFNPNHYLQRVRIQKACELLETSRQSFEQIAIQVGYQDASACRKVFVKVMGLTPVEFRRRFSAAE
ncbi:GlxA family transcriptional regulator [Vibrio sp.]|uniref:GlxA family transcriptional regulator n=1 Tax=Vibrio sp. TaxID=678 RepID=UPI003D0F0023